MRSTQTKPAPASLEDTPDVDIDIALLAADQYGVPAEIERAELRLNDIGQYLAAAQQEAQVRGMNGAVANIGYAWDLVVKDHEFIGQMNVLLSGYNAALPVVMEQRNQAIFDRAKIDEAIQTGKSDDPELRVMLRKLEAGAHYVIWNSMDETLCRMFPHIDPSAIHNFLNALSAAEPMTAYQYEMLTQVLMTFANPQAAAS